MPNDESTNTASVTARLEQARASIKERQAKLARHTQHRESPLPQDFAEQAVELENDETMVALERELTDELDQIEAALRRLEAGTYTTCASCGETIDPARLEALPSTTRCIDCAG